MAMQKGEEASTFKSIKKKKPELTGERVIPLSNYRAYGYQRQAMYERKDGCICQCEDAYKTPAIPEVVSVAMAYVPFQECNDVYQIDKALCAGTIFPVLDKPFLAGCC